MIRSLDKKAVWRLRGDFINFGQWSHFYCPLISTAFAARDFSALRVISPLASRARVPYRTIREIILQTHLSIDNCGLFCAASKTRRALNMLWQTAAA